MRGLFFPVVTTLMLSSTSALAEVEYFQVSAQNRIFLPAWDMDGTKKVFAEAPTAEVGLDFSTSNPNVDWYHGIFLDGGVLYSGGLASGDIRHSSNRLMPFGVLGYSVRPEPDSSYQLLPMVSAGLLATPNGLGGEVSLMLTAHDDIGGPSFSGGLTAGYLTTGIEPGGDKLNYPFVGLRLSVGYIHWLD